MEILIVEDEPGVARELRRDVEKLGHSCAGVAVTLQEAVASLSSCIIDVAILDIDLNQQEDGLDLAPRLRKNNIPFIVVSGLPDMNTAKRISEAGAVAHLEKPPGLNNLRNALLKASVEKGRSTTSTSKNSRFTVRIPNNEERKRFKQIVIETDQLIAIEGDDKDCFLHLGEQKIRVPRTLKKVVEEITRSTNSEIIRISKSWAVNLSKIKEITGDELHLQGFEQVLKVSDNWKNELKQKLNVI